MSPNIDVIRDGNNARIVRITPNRTQPIDRLWKDFMQSHEARRRQQSKAVENDTSEAKSAASSYHTGQDSMSEYSGARMEQQRGEEGGAGGRLAQMQE